jgi:hypothetical protein
LFFLRKKKLNQEHVSLADAFRVPFFCGFVNILRCKQAVFLLYHKQIPSQKGILHAHSPSVSAQMEMIDMPPSSEIAGMSDNKAVKKVQQF